MDMVVAQLKKDFQSRIALGAKSSVSKDTLALLTKEELTEIERIWVQLAMWQKQHSS
ncbi:hypothetical protein [Vibrio sp. SCSIO 43136]|uniref:hypothetical protein n=1 Tax=Vibrio sp. SCSIO 43136 TaxID=2819101 RepID=UPI002074B9F3|nr:hypothetical protein [Vibrio sp. SCSIO 43136]USD66388.1 hypothetical protein J4N39_06145 [Vibrio sp. SCSIO 43136]